MKNKALKNFIKLASFLLIAVLIFQCVSFALERKTYNGSWNYMSKLNEFYDLPEDTVEYICVGSSHAYCTVNPLEVWNESGIKGFVLATQQQPLRASYHYIKEAFKTQSPKVVILEGLMAITDNHSEAVLYDAIDPLRFSMNKLEMINEIAPAGKKDAYYFNILKYHTRWKELSANNILKLTQQENDIYKGFVALNADFKAVNQELNYDSIETGKISEENLEALNDILEFVKGKGAELVLMIAPYDVDSVGGVIKAERIWAQENGVEILDYALMLDELGIDPEKDYYDASHLDISGAAKVSKHLSGILEQKGLAKVKDDASWEADYQKYMEIAQF